MSVKKKADALVKKYDTRNPITIAENTGYRVLLENLGTVNGYYYKSFRTKQIHINENLPQHLLLFTAAHELGHVILHPNVNTYFLKENTQFVVDKYENEANAFAIELLIPDWELKEYIRNGLTLDQIARIYGYRKELFLLKEFMKR